MRAWVLPMLVTCGPGFTQRPYTPPADVLAPVLDDPVGLKRLLRDDVVNGGVWFDDPACANAFGQRGHVPAAQFSAFARCLATLHLRRSDRVDAHPDVAVLRYGPFELEARVADGPSGRRLTWIGHELQRDDEDFAPTVVPGMLELLRTSGVRELPPHTVDTLDDLASGNHDAYAWIKYCVDTVGTVASVHALEASSPRAQLAFVDLVRVWRFRPFELGGAPRLVCAVTRLSTLHTGSAEPRLPPVPPQPLAGREAVVVPPQLLERRRIRGDKNITPSWREVPDLADANVDLVGTFSLCLDEHGEIATIQMLHSTGLPSYDRSIQNAIRGWAYKPYDFAGQPLYLCSRVTFFYRARS